MGVYVSQDNDIVSGGESRWIEVVFPLVFRRGSDGRAIYIDNIYRRLTEDAHSAYLCGVIGWCQNSFFKGLEVDPSSDVESYVTSLGGCTMLSSSRPSGDQRGLIPREAHGGLRELTFLDRYDGRLLRRKPTLEFRYLSTEPLRVPAENLQETSLISVPAVASVSGPPSATSSGASPVGSPTVGAIGGGGRNL